MTTSPDHAISIFRRKAEYDPHAAKGLGNAVCPPVASRIVGAVADAVALAA